MRMRDSTLCGFEISLPRISAPAAIYTDLIERHGLLISQPVIQMWGAIGVRMAVDARSRNGSWTRMRSMPHG